jgi:TP901 family phage tail tape measure protein
MPSMNSITVALRGDASNLNKSLATASSKLSQFGTRAKAAGGALTKSVSLPLVAAGAASIKAASDFEASMTKIQTLVGLSGDTVKGFKEDVLALSGETGRAPKELADAMFFITSAGLRGADAVEALKASAEAAALGLGETEGVADAVTNAINGYGAANINASEATDILIKTVEQGKASAEDLAPQFGRLIPMAAELGVSFEQVGGSLAFLTRSSGNASLSTTQFQGVLRSIIKPTIQAEKALETAGISMEELRARIDQDMLGGLQFLRTSLEDSGQELGKFFLDAQALTGVLQFTGQSVDDARGVFDAMADSTGALDRGFKIVQETAQFKLQKAMATVKATLITLGEQVIPVVVPMIQKLAEWIGRAADWFDQLSPFMKKTIVVVAGLAAALGPLLMVVGMVASGVAALIPIVAGVGAALAAAALPITAVVAAGALLTAWFISSRKEAAEARDRQEELTAAFAAEGNEATLLVGRLDSVIERHIALKGATEEVTARIEAFKGSSVLLGLALEREVGTAMEGLGLTGEQLESALQGGTDEFQRLEGMAARMAVTTDRDLIKALRNADSEINDVTSALADQFAAGEINRSQLRRMLDALDETADAYDDHHEQLDKDAKKTLENADKQRELAEILSTSVVENTIAAARESGNYAYALDSLTRRAENAVAGEEARAAALAESEARQAGFVTMLVDSSRETGAYTTATEEAAVVVYDAAAAVALVNENLEAGKGPMGQAAEDWNALTEAAMTADRALLATASGGMNFDIENDTLTNTAHWVGVVARQRADAAAAEEAAQKATKDALEEEKRLEQEIADQLAEQRRVEQEIADRKAEALRLANSLRAAQADVTAAAEDMATAERDIARAKKDVEGVEERITDLEAESVALTDERLAIANDLADVGKEIERMEALTGEHLFENAEFARAFEHSMDKAKLTVIDLQKKVDDLTATRDATVDTGTAQATVDALAQQQATVNEVEQALIDMNVIKEEDAGFMDLTVKEAKTLQRLERQLRKVEREYEDGEADLLDLLDATEDYERAMADARLGSNELRRAQEALSEANAAANELKKEQENIDLKLKVAEEDLRLAKVAANKETQKQIIIDEESERIKKDLLKLRGDETDLTERQTEIDSRLLEIVKDLAVADQDLAAAKDKVTAAEQRLADATEEHGYALVRLQRVQEELNDVQRTQNDLWRELVALINDAGGAFRDLKRDVANVTSGGGGGDGGGAPTGPTPPGLSPPPGPVKCDAGYHYDAAQDACVPNKVKTPTPPAANGGGGDPVGDYLRMVDNLDFQSQMDLASAIGAFANPLEEAIARAGGGTWTEGHFNAGDTSSLDFFASAQKGGVISKGGLVNLHAGEVVTPAGRSGVNVVVNVEGSVVSERELVEMIRKGLLRSQQSGKSVVL